MQVVSPIIQGQVDYKASGKTFKSSLPTTLYGKTLETARNVDKLANLFSAKEKKEMKEEEEEKRNLLQV